MTDATLLAVQQQMSLPPPPLGALERSRGQSLGDVAERAAVLSELADRAARAWVLSMEHNAADLVARGLRGEFSPDQIAAVRAIIETGQQRGLEDIAAWERETKRSTRIVRRLKKTDRAQAMIAERTYGHLLDAAAWTSLVRVETCLALGAMLEQIDPINADAPIFESGDDLERWLRSADD